MRYFICRTECQDGGHEYNDAFILELPESFDVDKYPDYGEEGYSHKSLDYFILNWNYGNAKWNDDQWENDGGERFVDVTRFEEIPKEDADLVGEKGYLTVIGKEWLDGSSLSPVSGGVQ